MGEGKETKKKVLIVLGMHRSGTSAITRGLTTLGANLGNKLLPPLPDTNPTGFWEDMDIYSLDVEIISSLNRKWWTLSEIPKEDIEKIISSDFYLRAISLLQQKIIDKDIFAFKDPRVARITPFWAFVVERCKCEAGFIIVIRNPLSVVRSLAKRDNLLPSHSYILWLGHVLASLKSTKGMPRIIVDYDDFIEEPRRQLANIASQLDLHVNELEAANYQNDFLSRTLRHTTFSIEDLLNDARCPRLVIEVYSTLKKYIETQNEFSFDDLEPHIANWTKSFEDLEAALSLADDLLMHHERLTVANEKNTDIIKTLQGDNARMESIIKSNQEASLRFELQLRESDREKLDIYSLVLEKNELLYAAEKKNSSLALESERLKSEMLKYKTEIGESLRIIDDISSAKARLESMLGENIIELKKERAKNGYLENLIAKIYNSSASLMNSITESQRIIRDLLAQRELNSDKIGCLNFDISRLENELQFARQDNLALTHKIEILNSEHIELERTIRDTHEKEKIGLIESSQRLILENAEQRKQLELIERSKAWELVLALRRIRVLILPPHSLREKTMGNIMKVLKMSLARRERMNFEEKNKKTFLSRFLLFLGDSRKQFATGGFWEGVRYISRRIKSRFLGNNREIGEYQNWIAKTEKKNIVSPKVKVEYDISIIVPVYNTNRNILKKTVTSVIKQKYKNWELLLVDDCSTNRTTTRYLKRIAIVDSRIKVLRSKQNGGISAATNTGIDCAKGKYIAFLDHDDTIGPNALAWVNKAINDNETAEIIYSDEDKLDSRGRRCQPFFKPDWSLHWLMSWNYICHFLVMKKELIIRLGGLRSPYDGSQDYDLILRAVTVVEEKDIVHIPRILYHWRQVEGSTSVDPGNKSYAHERGKEALVQFINSMGWRASVHDGIAPGIYRVRWQILGSPSVDIIIPTKDKTDFLKKCIDSILDRTDYSNYRITIVDTGSKEKESIEYLNGLSVNSRIRVLKYVKAVFNFSEVNNWAVNQIDADFCLFLNNDTEIQHGEWLENMVALCQQSNVGIVGAKLVFPNNTIQHMGVVIGMRDGASHAGVLFPDWETMSFPFLCAKDTPREVSAVTGACLLIQRTLFNDIGGFDPLFRVAFNDIDLCLKVRAKGKKIIYTPFSKIVHYESATFGRPYEDPNRSVSEFEAEREAFRKKWSLNDYKDSYYNENLTLADESLRLRINQ